MNDLVLGPLLRHVDDRSAAVWVETAAGGTVRVVAGEHVAETGTFAVHGRHYALVELDGLPSGARLAYTVELDGERVWPPAGTPYGESVIATLRPGKPLRLCFGSCRTSVPHDAEGNRSHGIDALRAYALRMAGLSDASHEADPDPGDEVRWPDLVLFLGDQVYADETSEEMKEFIASRRDLDEEPGTELKDFEEYAHLYGLAWSDPANRWLLSTLPSLMIFDDHDVRDDWNTSESWREQMEATDWWHGRIVAALASYWVYQHLGNLSPAARAEDELWREISSHTGPGATEEYDASVLLDDFAARVDQDPEAYRWSYARDFDTQARLVVVDSRAARVLRGGERSMLDPVELAWLDEHVTGDTDHLLLATSLPFLLTPGAHHAEAFSEALADGAWGRGWGRVGERLRQTGDLEHWAAFQQSFRDVSEMVLDAARGGRGRPPATITFLSGDVHHSYLAEARPTPADTAARGPVRSRILQAVCSPIRNPMGRVWRFAMVAGAYGVAPVLGRVVTRSAHVPDPPLTWRMTGGPWFQNFLATLEVGGPEGRDLRLWWATGEVADDPDRPRLRTVADEVVTTR